MNLNKNIFVFPCGSEIGLEIHNSLKWSNHCTLFGGSSIENHGKFVYKNYIPRIPFVNSKNFLSKINQIIKKYKIDYIFPAHDDVLTLLSKARHENKLDCDILTSPYKTTKICRSKQETYNLFENKIRTPHIYKSTKEITEYPVFLKPTIGQGSKGTFMGSDLSEIEFHLKHDPTLLILEYLPGKEYTIDCFTDSTGKLLFVGQRERIRTVNGISVNTKPVNIPELQTIAEIINSTIELTGVWFFQMKYSKNNELTLLEIAPRVAGTMALYRNLGINFPLLTIFNRLGYEVKIQQNRYDIELDRALFSRFLIDYKYDTVYIDLDDCLIFRNKLNPLLISFIVQCFNDRKNIVLLSRHSKNIKSTFKKYRIEAFFDKVIKLEPSQEKSEFIKSKRSIFIDDSYSERQKIIDTLHIPTFDPMTVESLINWKY